jgi:crotonobetainyl-CoA:carnitine CoA-transferase CaiB-like acyl-CoA transferase
MLDVLDAPEIADDPRFAENSDRMTHLKELEDLLGAIFAKQSTEAWLARLDAAGVPAGPVLNVNEMHKDPQSVARDMVVEVDHAQVGPVKTLGIPVKFSETPGRVAEAAPVYGQHTREVLAEYEYGDEDIEKLISSGAVVAVD